MADPALPPGFTVDEAPPPGFTLDQPQAESPPAQELPGFSDEQKQQILDYIPKAKDAADLERFSGELTQGRSKIGNAKDVLEKHAQGHKQFGWTPPTPAKESAKPDDPLTIDHIRQAVGDALMNIVAPGLGSQINAAAQTNGSKAFVEHAANAAALDYGPEVGALIDTILHPGSSLPRNAAHEHAILSGDSEGHPVASTLGELTGVGADAVLGNAAGLANLGRGARVATTMGEGALYGSGAAGPGNRVEGGAVGAVAAPVIGLAAKAPAALIGAGKSVMEGSPGLARRIISSAIKQDTNTPESVGTAISEAQANGVPMALGDTGENARGLLAASARASGIGRTVVRDALEDRQSQLADRITGHIERDLGPVANPHQVADDLMTTARDNAGPLYDAAYARPGAQTFGDKVAPLLQRPSMRKAIGKAYRIAQEEGRDPETLGFQHDPVTGETTLTKVPSWQTLDYVKRGLDDVIEGYRDTTTGKLHLDTEGRAINNTKNSFLKAFDAANPDYASARQAWSGPVSGISAMNLGRKALNMTGDDLEARMRDMTDSEKQLFGLGIRRAMAETVQAKGDTADIVNALVGTGKKRAMLARAFGDRKQFQRFVDTLGQEREGWRSFKQALLGSPTAANAQDDSALQTATIAADLMTTGLPVATSMRYALKFGVGKLGEKAKQQVAALLSNTDPAAIRELAAELRTKADQRGIRVRRLNNVTRAIGKGSVAAIGQQQAQ